MELNITQLNLTQPTLTKQLYFMAIIKVNIYIDAVVAKRRTAASSYKKETPQVILHNYVKTKQNI